MEEKVVSISGDTVTTKEVLTATWNDPERTAQLGLVYLSLASLIGILYKSGLLDWVPAAISFFHIYIGMGGAGQ